MKTNIAKSQIKDRCQRWLWLAGIVSLSIANGVCADAVYPALVAGHHPLAYYRFQTAPAATNLNLNNGSLGAAGNATNYHTKTWEGGIAGDPDDAQFFDSAAWTTVPWNASLNPANTQPFTVEAWFYPAGDQIDVGPCPVNNRTVYTGLDRQGWVFYQRAPDDSYQNKTGYSGVGWNFRMYRGAGSATGLDITSQVPYQLGKWTHLAVVYEPANLTNASVSMYVDGQLAASVTYSGAGVGYVANSGNPNPTLATNGPAGLTLGSYNNTQPGSNPFFGAIDEFAFYDHKLTAAQILAHYQNGTNANRTTNYSALIKADAPVEYLRLDERGAGPVVAVNMGDLRADGHGTNSPSVRHVTRDALVGRTDRGAYSGHLRDGGLSFVSVPWRAELNPGPEVPFTIEGWYRPTNDRQTPTASPICNRLAFGIPNRTGWLLYQRAPNDSYLGVPIGGLPWGVGWHMRTFTGSGTSSGGDIFTGVPYTMGEWQYVVFTWQPTTDLGTAANGHPVWMGTITAYANGVAVSTNENITYASNQEVTDDLRTPADFTVGAYNLASGIGIGSNPGDEFEGDIDEVAFYNNYLLTPDQILAHYQTGTNAHPATNYETLVLTAAYQGAASPQRSGPKLYYRFSEPPAFPITNNGTLGPSANGSLLLAVTNAGPTTAGFESANGAIELNGVTSWAALDNPAVLNITNQITLEAWIKPDATQTNIARIISHGPSTATYFDLNVYSLLLAGSLLESNEVSLSITDAGANYFIGSSDGATVHGVSCPVPSGDLGGGQWIHLVGTYDGSYWRLFRNGIEVTNTTDSVGALPASYGDWAIGATGNGWADGFAGAVDEVAIYDKALTPATIATHYYVAQSGAVVVSITRSGGSTTIHWPVGTLQQADALTGVWTNVPSAVPPSYPVPPSAGSQKFYRVKL